MNNKKKGIAALGALTAGVSATIILGLVPSPILTLLLWSYFIRKKVIKGKEKDEINERFREKLELIKDNKEVKKYIKLIEDELEKEEPDIETLKKLKNSFSFVLDTAFWNAGVTDKGYKRISLK